MWLMWPLAAVVVIFGLAAFRGAPYLPSKRRQVDEAFRQLYPLGRRDVMVDIGSGDGLVLRAAARRGARAVGYEINPLLVVISRLLCRQYKGTKTVLADYFFVSFPADTTVVYVFSESRDIGRMADKVANEAERLGRPLFFISYGFEVPRREPVKTYGAYYLYTFYPLHPA